MMNKWQEQIYTAANGVAFQSRPESNGVRKIYFSSDRDSWTRLHTGLGEHLDEIAPVAEFTHGICRISFLAGNPQQPESYNLYRLLAENEPPVHESEILNISAVARAHAGYVSEFTLVYTPQACGPIIIAYGNTPELNLTFADAASYEYIGSNPQAASEIIICGYRVDGTEFSRIFDLVDHIAYEYSEGKSPRKILPEELVKISPGQRCRYAQDTSRKAFVNIPCRGNAIVCRHDGHLTYSRNCTQLNCRYFLT